MDSSLLLFDRETAKWFDETLGVPTPVQKMAWPAIASGGHVLVSAPTGTGKTLSAFLVFLDRLKAQALNGTLERKLYLIYVSPLKSLAADIRENLRRPLAGIGGEELVRVAVRTGDTTQQERQQMVRRPPHILIITPESLYLMLTGKNGQGVLCTAKAVIVDELHALIDTKRGAHLMLSLARLDALCEHPLQRIGLSATIAPLEGAAQYLAPEPVFLAAPTMEKRLRLEVLGSYVDHEKRRKDPVWEELSELVYRYCQGRRSVIAFVEGRRYAEKLAYYVNLKASQSDDRADGGEVPASYGGGEFARVHHGSLSKEQRQETEHLLREGKLRLLCATSSMELGIDVGEIDQVLQVGCPRTISGTMQRLGRAGHNPSRTSVMYLFPRTAAECVLCGMTAKLAREGRVEQMNPPQKCLDVLAQHLVSMAAFRSYELDEVMDILPRAWPFRSVTREEVQAVLRMLAGDYEHERDVPVRPRILYDRIHERVEGDGYSRMLAVSAGGTIPDKGLYTVQTEEGVRIGEADEEFVYETRRGDRFILGAFAWKVTAIGRDTVTVVPAKMEGARVPFWKGELKGRSKETGIAFGRILRELADAEESGTLESALGELGLDEGAAKLSAGYLRRQIEAAGTLADDRTIVAEHFRDQSGNGQLMIHSVFGRRVNAPLALLAARAAQQEMGENVSSVDEEDGFLLYSYGNEPMPEGLLYRIDPSGAEGQLGALLLSAPVFQIAFRYNCGRALMMGVRRNARQPLWMQRLRSAEMLDQVVRIREHPLIQETKRECMEQIWDVAGVREILEKIQAGEIRVREIYTETPSPMSLPLQWAQEAAVMYDYTPTPQGIHRAVEEALKEEQGLLRPGEQELKEVQERRMLPENAQQLHTLLMTEGDLAAGDLPSGDGEGNVPFHWFEELEEEGRAVYLEQGLWIAAEQEEEYREALAWKADDEGGPKQRKCAKDDEGGPKQRKRAMNDEGGPEQAKCGMDAALHIVRRMLRYRGGMGARQTALRYGWTEAAAWEVLQELCARGEAVQETESPGEGYGEGILFYHAGLYKRARRRTVRNRREEITTCPPAAYASWLISRIRRTATAEESIKEAIRSLEGAAYPALFWEEVLLPARVRNYRENLLDSFLASGEYFWHMEEGGRIRFDSTERIDWEAETEGTQWMPEELSGKEALVVRTLMRRGASFVQALGPILGGESPYDTLLGLMEKGIVTADSFVPVRQWRSREKIKKAAVRQRVGARVKTLHAGRWDLVRPLRPPAVEEKMKQCFDRYGILCRETAAACGNAWQEMLSVLRVQEYTGQVRRGYFVQGLSGVQFIRKEDFAAITSFLQRAKDRTANTEDEVVWMNAADPMQPWGRLLQHEPGRGFLNVSGSAVAFCAGRPVMLLERNGASLRIFEMDCLESCLRSFTEEYRRGSMFAGKKRIVVKKYPKEAAYAMERSGFIREMQDYALYR